MARLQRKNLDRPDEIRPVGNGTLSIVELGDVVIGRTSYEPGWRWSRDLKPLVGTRLCEFHHIGVVISGVLHVELENGSSLEIGPMDAFEIPPGHDAWVVGDEPWVSIDSVGRRHFGTIGRSASNRFLTTILFVDVVGSTELVRRLGDAAWRDLIAEHNAAARLELERFRGTDIGTIGDGLLAIFDSPAAGVRAADAIGASARGLGLRVRAGLHTGEVERAGDDVRGIAVHHAARVAGAADGDQILVSAQTRALLAGSGIAVDSVGSHELKGLAAPEELFRVVGL